MGYRQALAAVLACFTAFTAAPRHAIAQPANDDDPAQVVLMLNPIYRGAKTEQQFNAVTDAWVSQKLFKLQPQQRAKAFPLILQSTIVELDPVARYSVLFRVGQACKAADEWESWKALLFRELLRCVLSEWPIDRQQFEAGLEKVNVAGGLKDLNPANSLDRQCATSLALAMLNGAPTDKQRYEAYVDLTILARVCRGGPIAERFLGSRPFANPKFVGVMALVDGFSDFNQKSIDAEARSIEADVRQNWNLVQFADRIKVLERQVETLQEVVKAHQRDIHSLKEFRDNAQQQLARLNQQADQFKQSIDELFRTTAAQGGQIAANAKAIDDAKQQITDLQTKITEQVEGVVWIYNADWSYVNGLGDTQAGSVLNGTVRAPANDTQEATRRAENDVKRRLPVNVNVTVTIKSINPQ